MISYRNKIELPKPLWNQDSIKCVMLPSGAFLVASIVGPEVILYDSRESSLLHSRLDVDLSSMTAIDDTHVSILSADQRSLVLFNFLSNKIELKTDLNFFASALLFLESGWIVAGLNDQHVFHSVSFDGSVLVSFGSSDVLKQCSDTGVMGSLGSWDVYGYKGFFSFLGAERNAFVFAYSFVPIVQAFQIQGTPVWTTVLHPKGNLSSYMRSSWNSILRQRQSLDFLLVELNDDLAVGGRIAVLHTPPMRKREMSVLELSGVQSEIVTLPHAMDAVFWHKEKFVLVRRNSKKTLQVWEYQ